MMALWLGNPWHELILVLEYFCPWIALSIIFLSAFYNTKESAFARTRLSHQQQSNLQAYTLFLVFGNHQLNDVTFDPFNHPDCSDISVNFIGKGRYGFERFVHLYFIQSNRFSIIFHSDPIICFASPLVDPEFHLGGQMIQSIIGWFDQLQLVLNVALVVLLFKRPNDFIDGQFLRRFVIGVHILDEII